MRVVQVPWVRNVVSNASKRVEEARFARLDGCRYKHRGVAAKVNQILSSIVFTSMGVACACLVLIVVTMKHVPV
jgi:hypothetical protein